MVLRAISLVILLYPVNIFKCFRLVTICCWWEHGKDTMWKAVMECWYSAWFCVAQLTSQTRRDKYVFSIAKEKMLLTGYLPSNLIKECCVAGPSLDSKKDLLSCNVAWQGRWDQILILLLLLLLYWNQPLLVTCKWRFVLGPKQQNSSTECFWPCPTPRCNNSTRII